MVCMYTCTSGKGLNYCYQFPCLTLVFHSAKFYHTCLIKTAVICAWLCCRRALEQCINFDGQLADDDNLPIHIEIKIKI